MNNFEFLIKSKLSFNSQEKNLINIFYSNYLIENKFDFKSFVNLSNDLFTDLKCEDLKHLTIFFNKFDLDKDNKLNQEEFKNLWECLIKKIIFPKSALIIVDMQNDFINGSLSLKDFSAKENPEETIFLINKLIEELNFDLIVYTLDWHPDNHISFIDNFNIRKIISVNEIPFNEKLIINKFDLVKFETKNGIIEQKLWPKHCVQNSKGAEIHEKLIIKSNGIKIFKGIDSEIDSYSAFYDNLKLKETKLNKILKKNQITHFFACGVAVDFCVGETIKEAIELKYFTILIEDACSGINKKSILEMKKHLKKKNCLIENSVNIKNILNGMHRPFRFALNFI